MLSASHGPLADKDELSSAAQAADIIALGRAALDAVTRAVRTAPEVKSARLMARGSVDLEDLLLELEPMQAETPIATLALRLGVSSSQLRATALKLQRLALVRVSSEGVALTVQGRQKLARLEQAQALVLRRIAEKVEGMSLEDGRMVLGMLHRLIDSAEGVVGEHAAQPPTRTPSGTGRQASVGSRLGAATPVGLNGAGR